jgi:hypothetical protein
MRITDSNGYMDVKIKPDFVPDTKLSLVWFQLANDEWAATDRGADADTYDCDIRLYRSESQVQAFIDFMEANRNASTNPNILTLSNFNAQEHIYGADLDYTSITATVFMDRRRQGTWKGFEQTLRMSCVSPSFVGGTPNSFPLLQKLNVGYDADSDRTINKFDSYNRTFQYQEHSVDSGLYSGVYTFTDEEMIQIRRLVATKRATAVAMPTIIGVDHPFGRRSNSTNVKIMEFEDMGMYSVVLGKSRWKAKITLIESFEVI